MTVRVLTMTVVLAGLALTPAWAGEPATAPAAKIAVPDASALKEARKAVDDIYVADIAKARTPEEKLALAKKFLQSAIETKDDDAGKYVLLGMAKDLAVGAGDAETALAAIGGLGQYRVDSLALKCEALAAVAKANRGQDAKAMVERINPAIDEAIAADRYDLARQLAQLGVAMAKAAKELDAIKAAAGRVQEVENAQALFAQVKEALSKLAQSPKDPESNLLVGRFYCLTQGRWGQGLPMLAMGGDAALKELAQQDLAKPADAKKQAELGDGWWDLAVKEKENAAAQRQVKQHACEWYAKALPRLAGPQKVKIEERLATVVAKASQGELILNLGNKVTMKLVLIPAGTFTMGSAKGELGHSDAEEAHEVKIGKPFYMGVYPVTQEQYKQMIGKNLSYFKGDTNPVERVSWNKAADFCKALSKKTGKRVRLPTEAQWEYACRAGTTTHFNTGDTLSTNDANYSENFPYPYGDGKIGEDRKKTTPVDTFKPNAWGLCDMHGNVWQWCNDWYDPDYYGNSPKADPQGPGEGKERVTRGGAWSCVPINCRSAARNKMVPGEEGWSIGFRVVVLTGSD